MIPQTLNLNFPVELSISISVIQFSQNEHGYYLYLNYHIFQKKSIRIEFFVIIIRQILQVGAKNYQSYPHSKNKMWKRHNQSLILITKIMQCRIYIAKLFVLIGRNQSGMLGFGASELSAKPLSFKII